MKKIIAVAGIVVMLALTAGLVFAAEGDVGKAESLVKKGVAFYNANGEEKALEEFSNPKGQFVDGEFYLFLVDFSGMTNAHGGNPALIGKNMKDLKDADGKFFIQEMINIAKTKGNGWSDYKWKNPKTGEVMPKSSYVERVGDSFIGCGIYKK